MVSLFETMYTNGSSLAAPSLLHSAGVSSPGCIPRLSFPAERFQGQTAALEAACSGHLNIHGKLEKQRKFGVCSSSGNGAVKTQVQEKGRNGSAVGKGTAVVWFKRDLRLDDHPGLLMAADGYEKVVPLYVIDPVLLADWSAELVKALWDAVQDLRQSLQAIDSDLVIRFGRTPNVLRAIAREVGPSHIITEEEVEMEWHQVVRSVSASLAKAADAETGPLIKHWRSCIYEIEGVEEMPHCYKTFQQQKYPYAAPLDPPKSLPPISRSFDKGVLPSFEEIWSAIEKMKLENPVWEGLKGVQDAETILTGKSLTKGNMNSGAAQVPSVGVLKDLAAWRERYIVASPYEELEKRRKESTSALIEEDGKGYVLKGGATGALNILMGYLRFLEPTGRDDWQEVYEHIVSAGLETRPGASFRALFGNALHLGTLSLRRIYHEAMDYEKARGGGWLSPFGFSSFTASAAIRDSKAIEWYQLLALKTRQQGREQGFQVGTWRWRGFLIQYALAGTSGPPVVFVHGFGAFWQHWRANINSVAESGHRVFALTMLGFGRSEKPLITYTDLVWGELVRDFIIEVVREPAIVAGNSIGGYTASVVAGLWPNLVKALVLLNSAGQVVPDYQKLKYNKPREKSSVAYVGSRLLLAYLQNLSNGMLTKCYPTVPSRADSWLQDEVMRASYDPNATAVLEAMFHLRAPLPLNYYLDRFSGDILIIQGMRDPLHNSSKRASMLQAYCKNVHIQYVNAGHCPHDEVPEDVNAILTTWINERKLRQSEKLAASENGYANGSASRKPVKEPSLSEGVNGVLPDSLVRLVEEVEELV